MDLSLFATQVLQTGGKASKNVVFGSQVVGANGLAIQNKADFLNAILNNLAQDQTTVKTDTGATNSNATPEKIKSETVDLALLQLALLGQDPDQSLDQKLAELRIERIQGNKENRVAQLTKLINHLTSGLPEPVIQNGNIDDLVSRLETRLEKLEARLESFRTGDFGKEGAPFQLLIATGLNPAQLTSITNKIEELEEKLGRELTVEDLIAGVGNIIPVVGSNEEEEELSSTDYLGLLLEHTNEEKQHLNDTSTKTVNGTHSAQPATVVNDTFIEGEDTAGQNNTAAHVALENLPPKTGLESLLNLTPALNIIPGVISPTSGDGAPTTAPETAAPIANIPKQLSNAEFNALFGSNGKIVAKAKIGNAHIENIAQRSPLPALAQNGHISLPVNFTEALSSQAVISEALGFDIQTGTPFNTTSQAVHASTSIPQAGQTHPATQTVAAQISKAAQNSDTRNITLQLDPPELGRVEVRLEFGEDRSVRAHLVVEKPETLLMLQRDTAALERALQNAGLETASDSLNYEMAKDDYAFNTGQDSHNGNNSANGNDANNAEAQEDSLIETTLTWDVDPETGHVHYTIFA